MREPLVSIIVRTKNEKSWIGKCLHAIKTQKYKNIEVIVVDNLSTDKTIQIIKKNFSKVKIVKYKEKPFLPGKAINVGIKKSKGKFIAIVSGHCIPKNNFWIKNLIKNFKNKRVAGVYGRQEPLDVSESGVVRELMYLFGKDKKIQNKDPFFHNANSMIRRDLWNKFKFDNKTFHIEDRIWAQQLINKGYKIVYEPEASVFHHHGVGHDNDISRVKRITNILSKIDEKPKKTKIVCMIPILDPIKIGNSFIVERPLKEVLKIKKITKIIIICDNKELKNKLKNKKILFINRGFDLKKDYLGKDFVLKEIFNKFIQKKYNPSHILVFEEVYPNRPANFFKNLVNNIDNSFDSIIPIAKSTSQHFWSNDEKDELQPLFKSSLPSIISDKNIYQEIKGLGSITKSTAFSVNGRECSNPKFFEVKQEHLFKIDNFTKNLIS